MRRRLIFFALIVLTISWKISVDANRNQKTNSNQIGWRFNVTNNTSQYTKNNNTRTGNRSHNNTAIINKKTNSTRVTAANNNSRYPSRNSTHVNHGRVNNTRITPPNRGSNSTPINQRRTNSTRISPPNHGQISRNATNINNGRTNSTNINRGKVSPPNHGSGSINRKTTTTTNRPPVSRPEKKKEPSFTETFLDALQKELSKAATSTTPKPKSTPTPTPKRKIIERPRNSTRTTTSRPIVKTEQKISQLPPSTTLPPPTATTPTTYPNTPPPYPSTPLVTFPHNFTSLPSQVIYLPGGPFGYYVCPQVAPIFYPSPNNNFGHGMYPFTNNGTTGPYIQPGVPAGQLGIQNFPPKQFNNTLNFGNGPLLTQQGIRPGIIPQGTSGTYFDPNSIPQNIINGQHINPGSYTPQGSGYVQHLPTNTAQNVAYNQAGTNASNLTVPQGISLTGVIPQNSPGLYVQPNLTSQSFNNVQPGTPTSSVLQGNTGNVQPPAYNFPQYIGQPGLEKISQQPGYVQYPANSLSIDNVQAQSQVSQPGGWSQGLPNSNIQTVEGLRYGQPVVIPQSFGVQGPQNVQSPVNGNPLPYQIPHGLENVPQGFDQTHLNKQNIGNSQAGTIASNTIHPQNIPYGQSPQISNNGQPGFPTNAVHSEPGITQPQVHNNPQHYGNGQLATNGSYFTNQQNFSQYISPGSLFQPSQTANFSSNYSAPNVNPQGFLPSQPGTPYPPQGHINGLPISSGTPQPYIYGPQGQICTFVYNPVGTSSIPVGFPYIQPGSQGVPSAGLSNPFAEQHQFNPYWHLGNQNAQPISAYPNVQPNLVYTNAPPNSAYPNIQHNSGYPNAQPNSAYPNVQPNLPYTNAQPNSAYPNIQPTSGYPNAQPNSAYPNIQHNSGYPNIQPNSVNPNVQPNPSYPNGQPNTA